MSFAVRHKTGIRVYGDPAQLSSSSTFEAELQLDGTAFVDMAFSKDGAVFGVVDGDVGVRLFDATSRPYAPLRTLERAAVQGRFQSPLSHFFISFSDPSMQLLHSHRALALF